MRISPELRSSISKVIIITIIYLFFNWFLVMYNHTLLYSTWSLGVARNYSHWFFLVSNTYIGLLAGILGGGFMVYINSKVFRKKSFRYAMLTTFAAYSLTFFIIVITTPILIVLLKLGPPGASVGRDITNALRENVSVLLLSYYILWGFIVMITMFTLQINDKFGPGILIKFLLGKYHSPREEDRFFMFMDMKSSTSIAEKLGNKKYFNLLQDVFNDITDAIISCEGEIYQYVGDEIIISWTLEKGIKDDNCIRCFIEVQNKLKEIKSRYESVYGHVPEFKAGLHYGKVTAGEIGSIKKDIVYSGDVLNTTSRIQEQCNQYNVNFLLSKTTFDLIPNKNNYNSHSHGEISLRGKNEVISLISLSF